MRSATNLALIAAFLTLTASAHADSLREKVLRNAALQAGLIRPEDTYIQVPAKLAAAGKLLFESKILSLDQETACASCHLDQFGSSDGLPNAIGTEGRGFGVQRLKDGGDIIPRNTLPFWGRGGKGFDVFFWDGKVDASSGVLQSQFGRRAPSKDPLVVAVHLPPVEIGEMVTDSTHNEHLETESVETANQVYDLLIERVRNSEALGSQLAQARGIPIQDLTFLDAAEAIAGFIRQNFRIKATRFHSFVFDGETLTSDEIQGGLIFYGKGRCATCHNGPYFSDLQFHAIPSPQAGFGKNGFGIDYGRFNVTLAYQDRYLFRTPPLYNVSRTAPYSHSGSVATLQDAILAHTDPLAIYQPDAMTGPQRTDFYERLKIWAGQPLASVYLDKAELQNLEAFLRTLNFESEVPVTPSE